MKTGLASGSCGLSLFRSAKFKKSFFTVCFRILGDCERFALSLFFIWKKAGCIQDPWGFRVLSCSFDFLMTRAGSLFIKSNCGFALTGRFNRSCLTCMFFDLNFNCLRLFVCSSCWNFSPLCAAALFYWISFALSMCCGALVSTSALTSAVVPGWDSRL